jgi:peroxin-7
VYGVHSNYVQTELFASAGYDHTAKVWDINNEASVCTLTGHTFTVYNAVWHPRDGSVLATASGDKTAKVWDTRTGAPTMNLGGHMHEILSCD